MPRFFKAPFPGLSLTRRILLITAGCLFTAVFLLALVISRMFLAEMEKGLVQHQKEMADMVSRRMENALQARARTLEGFAHMLHDGQGLLPEKEIQALLANRIRLLDYFNGGLNVADAKAVVIAESIFVPGRIGTGYDDRPHIREARKTLKTVFTRPYMGRKTQTPLSTITVPILSSSGHLLGFLFGNTFLADDNLFREISDEAFGQKGNTLVIDPQLGLIVTASDFALSMKPLNFSGEEAVLEAVREGRFSGKTRNKGKGAVLYAANILDPMGWIVIHTLPARLAGEEVRTFVLKVVLVIIALMLPISLLLLLRLRAALLPLKQAAAAINAMAEGRMAEKPLPLFRMDEVGKLCLAFNRLQKVREEQETALREERDFLKSQFLQSSDGIALLAPHTLVIQEANPRLSRILGLSGESLEGRSLPQLLNAEEEELKARFSRVSETTGTEPEAYTLCHPEGRPIHVMVSATLVCKGRETRIMINVRDITEEKKSLEMKNEFVSTVSHELRTPLTAISGSLGLLTGGALGAFPEKAKSMLTIAQNNCRRLSMLINDLLDMEKLSADKMRFDFQEVDPAPLVRRAVTENQVYAEKFGVRLALDSSLPAVRIRADAQRLMQILANLLSNAAKFSPENSVVHIRMFLPDALRIRISVQDAGPGIPKEFEPFIFQKFSQSDATDSRSKEGTGLGLAITKALVEKMDGCIGFTSGEGRGTVFYVDFPLCQNGPLPMDCLPADPFPPATAPEMACPPEAASFAALSRKPRILVVEDEAEVTFLLKTFLEQGGYAVDTAGTGAEALARLRAQSYAAMTLDLALPDGDGMNLIHMLRTDPQTAHLPIVVLSAYADQGRLDLRNAFNAMDWIQKPFSPARLLDTVERLTAAPGNRKPRVLHVEDDPDLGEIIAAIAGGLASFDLVRTLKEALAAIHATSYDLIILDIHLPDGSGWELLPAVQDMHPKPPVIVLSSSEPSQDQVREVSAVLTKGRVSTETLLDTLREALRLSSGGKQ